MRTIDERLERAAMHLGVGRDHLTAIGVVSLGWVSAELDMQHAVWTMLGLTQRMGEIVTSYVGNVSRTELLRNAARAKFQDEANFILEVDDICAFYNLVRIERNLLSHALPPEGGSGNLSKRHTDGKPTGAIKSKEIQSDAIVCLDIFDDMMTFRRCAVPMTLNVQSAMKSARAPKTLMGHVATSPHIAKLRDRTALLRKLQNSR